MNVDLTRPQSEMFVSDARVTGVVAGFGAGKTKSLLTKCVSDLIDHHTDVGYFAPTVPLMRDIAFPVLQDILGGMNMRFKINKTENIVHTGFGNIICKSMENPDRIVGFEILKGYLDEFDILPTTKAIQAFHKVMARIRKKPKRVVPGTYSATKKNHNQAYIATTPEGFKATYQLFKGKDKLDDARLIQMSTYTNPHLPPGYIKGLIGQYPEQLIKAYLMGEFVNLTSGQVYNFDRRLHRVPQTVPSPIETLHIGQDFNVGKMASVIFVLRKSKSGEDVWLVIDEMVQSRDTPDLIIKLKERFPRNPIIIYPDASGKNRSTASISKSDHTLLRDAGFTLRVHTTNPFIKDRIASVNNALDKRKLYVSAGCHMTIQALEQQAYDRDGMPDKDNDLDHCADALGYFINIIMPVASSIARYNAVRHI